MIYRPIWSLPYENAVPDIPETSQIGDFEKVAFGVFRDYYAVFSWLRNVDDIEINYFKKRDCYYVFYESDIDLCPISNLQNVDGKMMNSGELYGFNWDKSDLSMSTHTCFKYFNLLYQDKFLDFFIK